jgi:hypothetical protein
MSTTKKIMVAVFALVTLQATAQKVKLGAKAGVNLANQTLSVGGEDFTSKLGLNLGLVTEFSFSKSISLQTGIGYNSRGAGIKHAGHTDILLINTIEIPLNVVYKLPSAKGSFILGAGPNVGLNLSAKVKGHDEPDEEIKIGSGAGQLKALDFGVNFVTGYEFNKNLFVQLNYNAGLTNLANVPGLTQRGSQFGLTLGYFFGK